MNTQLSNPTLKEVVEDIRKQLSDMYINQSQDNQIVFNVEKVELELEVSIEKGATGGAGTGGVLQWVVDLKLDANITSANRHKVKLILEPIDRKNPDKKTTISSEKGKGR